MADETTVDPATDATPAPRVPNYGRRILWLGVSIVVVIALYTGAWFYFANLLEKETRSVVQDATENGLDAACDKPTAHGYPFRMGVSCDRIAVSDPAHGLSVSTGAFRTAAQVYDLKHIVGEIDGPAQIGTPEGVSYILNWEGLHASVRLADPLPERISLEGKNVKASLASGTPLATIAAFEGHVRPNGDDVDLAGLLDGVAVDPSLVQGRMLPALSSRSDISIKNGVTLLDDGVENFRGQSGTIRTLTLTSGADAGVTLSGPFSVDLDGFLDADFSVTLRDPQSMATVLSDAFPEARNQIASGFAGLAFLGAAPTLPLKIVKGKAMLGFIPLGQIPPIF